MAGVWEHDKAIVGGKYLVQRRDGTVPDWPWFVMGGRDRAAPWAMRAYAVFAFLFGMDWAYVRGTWKRAAEFAAYRKANGTGDPDAPRHRKDDPEVIAKMAGGNPPPAPLCLLCDGPIIGRLGFVHAACAAAEMAESDR